MTPQKKPPAKKFAELQSQEIGKPISTHSLKPLDITETWEVHLGDKRTMFGQTKEEALERAGKYIKEREAQGLWWELKQCWRTERTKPYPMVLIIGSEDKHCGRPADAWVMRFSATLKKGKLGWVDSSGTRSVFWYTESKRQNPDYDRDSIDLPEDTLLDLKAYLDENKVPFHLLLRREDPGLGIHLDEDTPENHFSFREVS